MNPDTFKSPLFLSSLVLCGMLALTFVFTQGGSPQPVPSVAKIFPLEPALLEAKAAILYDPQSGEVLFEKSSGEQLPLASLTKLITAYLALETEESEVTITQGDLREEGDSGLTPGESWSLPELISFALVTSSNDAIAAAARAARINASDSGAALAALDLRQTFAMNPTGLDFSSSTAGAYGSAFDVARLFSMLLERHKEVVTPTVFAESLFSSLEGKPHPATSTGRSITDIPGLIAMKTGFTDLAGGNLAVVFDRDMGRPLVAVVLGSSREGRFEDMRTLIQSARHSGL